MSGSIKNKEKILCNVNLIGVIMVVFVVRVIRAIGGCTRPALGRLQKQGITTLGLGHLGGPDGQGVRLDVSWVLRVSWFFGPTKNYESFVNRLTYECKPVKKSDSKKKCVSGQTCTAFHSQLRQTDCCRRKSVGRSGCRGGQASQSKK